MKKILVILACCVPSQVFAQKSVCVDWFTFDNNFEEVIVLHKEQTIVDVYELCIGETLEGSHTLILLRSQKEPVVVSYEDIQSITCWFWSGKVEIKTPSGWIRFTAINTKVRERLQPYFQGKEIELIFLEKPPW